MAPAGSHLRNQFSFTLIMNFSALRAQRDTQKRFFEELCRLSSDDTPNATSLLHQPSTHLLPDHSFFSDSLLPSPNLSLVDSAPPFSTGAEFGAIGLYDHPDSSLEQYSVNNPTPDPTLQVDHCGEKVEEPSASSWIASTVLPDQAYSPPPSVCSSSVQNQADNPVHASMFAAAVTAAMIMDRADNVPKRPRTPAVELAEEAYESDLSDDEADGNEPDGDDNATEASMDYSEHAHTDERVLGEVQDRSPRSVSSFPNGQQRVATGLKVCRLAPTVIPQPMTTRTKATPKTSVQPEKKVLVHLDGFSGNSQTPMAINIGYSSHNSAITRKRRAEAMERFRKKKAVRCYGRKVRYQIRKRIATTRPRVNGRFARREDAEEHASGNK